MSITEATQPHAPGDRTDGGSQSVGDRTAGIFAEGRERREGRAPDDHPGERRDPASPGAPLRTPGKSPIVTQLEQEDRDREAADETLDPFQREDARRLAAGEPELKGKERGEYYEKTRDKANHPPVGSRTAASTAPVAVNWLWPGRLAKGKLTVTDGNPGVGKSARQIDTAARLSTGRDWPDARNTLGPVNVGIISAEDDEDDTIVPRLIAAGADLNRIHFYDESLSIPDDMEQLERWIDANHLVWIGLDPLAAYVSDKNDLNHDQKTRRALAPLQEILQRTRCSLEGLRHTNKLQNVSSALDKGSGSRAIGGASRVNLFVARDPHDPETIVLATVKGNLSIAPPSLTYKIRSKTVAVKDIETGETRLDSYPVIEWTGRSELSADDLLSIQRQPSKVEEAVDFLNEILSTGTVLVSHVEKMATKEGISIEGALKQARKRMTDHGELTNFKDGLSGPWFLELIRHGGARNEPAITEGD